MTRGFGYLVALLVGALVVPLGAQAIVQLTNGTFASKGVLSDIDGDVASVVAGYLQVGGLVQVSGTVDTAITNTPSVIVDNLGPTSSSAYAATPCYHVTTASTNATSCADAQANFYGIRAVNTTQTIAYVRLYNLASAPTCNSATGFIESIPIPPASASGLAGGIVAHEIIPTNYATGLGFCATGGGSSTDSSNAPAGVYVKL